MGVIYEKSSCLLFASKLLEKLQQTGLKSRTQFGELTSVHIEVSTLVIDAAADNDNKDNDNDGDD